MNPESKNFNRRNNPELRGEQLTPEQQELVLRYMDIVIPKVGEQIRKISSNIHSHIDLKDLSDELCQAGYLGLVQAALNFKPDGRNGRIDFKTYAEHRIRGAIKDYLRKIDTLTRDDRDRLKRIRSIQQNFFQTHNRFPTEEEIAETMGISITKYRKLIAPFSYLLNENRGGNNNRVRLDYNEPSVHFEAQLNSQLDRQKILNLIRDMVNNENFLTNIEKMVMKIYLESLESEEELSSKEISRRIGLYRDKNNRERLLLPHEIYQIKSRAIKKL
jgi:RNA polymerase sigma factor for flagellar operon FliA